MRRLLQSGTMGKFLRRAYRRHIARARAQNATTTNKTSEATTMRARAVQDIATMLYSGKLAQTIVK